MDFDVLYGFANFNLILKPFLMVSWHIPMFLIRGGGEILSDFRELSSFGPCGPFISTK